MMNQTQREHASRACNLLTSLLVDIDDTSEVVGNALEGFSHDTSEDAMGRLIELQETLNRVLPDIGQSLSAIESEEMDTVTRMAIHY